MGVATNPGVTVCCDLISGVLDYSDQGPGHNPFRSLTEKKLKETVCIISSVSTSVMLNTVTVFVLVLTDSSVE